MEGFFLELLSELSINFCELFILDVFPSVHITMFGEFR